MNYRIQFFHFSARAGLEEVNYFKQPEKYAIKTYYYPYLNSDLSRMTNQELFWLSFFKNGSSIKTTKADKVWNFLKRGKISLLREAYIAFLAAQDMRRLDLSREVPEDRIVELKSEKELADFEQREVLSNPLFKAGRLRKFFPKNSGIEYFFTGMFVNNLLWNKKQPTAEKEKVN